VPEAVIVAAARTPIGRAYKGALKDMRPDDLAAHAVRSALNQVPELDASTVRDLMLGCGAPGGEQGFNMGRVVSTLLGLDTVPGTTVTRYCASSLQTARMAMHAIRAGEGDVFIARQVSRRSAAAGPGTVTARRSPPTRTLVTVQETRGPTRRSLTRRHAPRGGQRVLRRSGRTRGRVASCQTSTSRWGRLRRTWPRCEV
jgi:acetyl-CoA acetyltransferase